MIEFAIAAAPLLALIVSLLFGRYPGHEAALRFAERIGSRVRTRISAAARSLRPRPPAAHAVNGGLLVAFSLSGRAPPASR